MRRIPFPWCSWLKRLNEVRQGKGVVYLAQVTNCSLLHLNQSSAWKASTLQSAPVGALGISSMIGIGGRWMSSWKRAALQRGGKSWAVHFITGAVQCPDNLQRTPKRKMLKLNYLTSLVNRVNRESQATTPKLKCPKICGKFIPGLQELGLQVFPAHSTDVNQKYWLLFVCQPGESALTQTDHKNFWIRFVTTQLQFWERKYALMINLSI